MLDLLFLLGIAVVIFIRLFKIFGQTDGVDKLMVKCQGEGGFEDSLGDSEKEVNKLADIEIISATEAALPPAIRDVFDSIRAVESDFNADAFTSGVKKAFIMIINAFTKHDKQSLQMLLSGDVYQVFLREIDNRVASGFLYSKTVVGVKEVEIIDASISGKLASIAVKIISEQVSYVKDKAGNLLNGNAEKIVTVEDVWQFSKQIGKDRVWLLVSTSFAKH